MWGESYIANKDVIYGVVAGPLGEEVGIKTGDKLVAVNGEPIEDFRTVTLSIVRNKAETITINRDGKNIDLSIDAATRIKLRKAQYGTGFGSARQRYGCDDCQNACPYNKSSIEKRFQSCREV